MKRLVLLGFLLAGCSPQPAATASPPAAPAASAPMARCSLAVIQGSRGQGSGPQTAGFLAIPDNSFHAAADAGDGMFYDRPLKRWIGWGPPAMSPDGTRYAYVEFVTATTTSRIHLIDVQTGTDRVVASGGPWLGVGLDGDAVYVEQIAFVDSVAFGSMEVGKGLWKIPLDGTPPTQLTTDARNWAWVAGGAAYADRSTLDVSGSPNDILRLDLHTMQEVSLFNPGARSSILAVDGSGAVLVATEASDEELWRVASPGSQTEIWSGSTQVIRPSPPVAVDGSDVWFSSDSPSPEWAIYHYSVRSGLQRVALFTDRPMTVAGPCA